MLRPDVQIFTPYGATESLPVSSIGSREVLEQTCRETENGKGICVGKPVDSLDVKIIQISDQPILEWHSDLQMPTPQIGEIVVRGNQVTAAYYNRQASTQLAKIRDGNSGFYHRMGDTGYFDEMGRLWFCGRLKHRVITDESTLFTIPCEGVFNVHSAVFRSALVAIQREGQTVPALCVELEEDYKTTELKVLFSELTKIAKQFTHTQNIQDFFVHPAFPVDIRHNAKIGREKLALWAQKEFTRRNT